MTRVIPKRNVYFSHAVAALERCHYGVVNTKEDALTVCCETPVEVQLNLMLITKTYLKRQ